MAASKKNPKPNPPSETFEQGDTINFDDVEAATRSILPRGKYPVTVVQSEYAESAAGNPMWSLQLEVNDGEYERRKLFHHIVFSAGALPFAKASLKALAPEMLDKPINPQEGADELVGKTCIAVVGVGKYQDEPTNNVQRLEDPSASSSSTSSFG